MTSSAFTQKRMGTKRKSPEDDRALRGFSPALLCGRKSCVRLHTNYHCRIGGRQAVRHRISRRPDPELPRGAGTIGAEAPRQRRAQRAEGKRLRRVAPMVASTSAALERRVADYCRTCWLMPVGTSEFQTATENWRYAELPRPRVFPGVPVQTTRNRVNVCT